jgi:hypothetical protein
MLPYSEAVCEGLAGNVRTALPTTRPFRSEMAGADASRRLKFLQSVKKLFYWICRLPKSCEATDSARLESNDDSLGFTRKRRLHSVTRRTR